MRLKDSSSFLCVSAPLRLRAQRNVNRSRAITTGIAAMISMSCGMNAVAASDAEGRANGFLGLGALTSIVPSASGPVSVVEIHALFSATFYVVTEVQSATVMVTSGFESIVHDVSGGSGGVVTWAPQVADASVVDSFVTIGDWPFPGNTTIPGAGWGPDGFESVEIPLGAGWANGAPLVLQGKAQHVAELGPATLIASFAIEVVPGQIPPAVDLGATVVFGTGPGTPSTEGVGAITQPFATVTAVGDVNADGAVDGSDLGLLLSTWGTTGAGGIGDLNADGSVDGADLGLLLSAWGVAPARPSP